MQQNYQTTQFPQLGENIGPGYPPNAEWSDPNNITADDGNEASTFFFMGGQRADSLVASDFDFQLPPGAVIDGISVFVDGGQIGCYGDVVLRIDGDPYLKSIGTLSGDYGGPTDLWGAESVSISQLDTAEVAINIADISGGDGSAAVDYLTMTVYWHLDLETAPADVPTSVVYKVYNSDGRYLGDLPRVNSQFGFSQDMGSVGSSINIDCADLASYNPITTSPILTDDDDEILTDDDLDLLAEEVETIIATGASSKNAMFKNSNRIKVWVYDYWHPNGKCMFSGQVNKVSIKSSGTTQSASLYVISDSADMSQYIARGYPFSYTNDVSQTSQNGYVTVTQDSKGAGWVRFGQTWLTGAIDNIGALTLKLQGTASVTVSVFNSISGGLLGSATRSVSNGSATDVQFEFPQLIELSPSTTYFFAVSVAAGQSIRVYKHGTSTTYANGSMYQSNYAGGSGGGDFFAIAGDMYFITKSGVPTTTATYSTQDPITGMMSGILLDYNARGGFVTERDFTATGLSVTYQFNQSTVFDALRKVIELSPIGFYPYIDLATSEIDILEQSQTADYTVVRGKDVAEIDLTLSIEQVKNYLLFTGGPAPTTNLYRDYKDTESSSRYGLRTVSKTDNRVTLSATADAIGQSFIAENATEVQESSIAIPSTAMDTTLLTPGKTIGFRNFGNFIDSMVLQIVRRDYSTKGVTLTLGRLPVMTNSEIQRINRQLLNEQTLNNPSAPN